jgi:TniQ
MSPRTLPIRVAPLPGEALESWLGTLAQRLNTPWGDLLTAIAPATKPASLRRRNLTAYLQAEESAAIAAATGVWQATVESLTLSRYDGRLVAIDRSTGRLRSAWTPVRSRFCPRCLHASGGRWQLAWRLPWVFACQEHSCVLADACPTCGQFQRVNPWWLSSRDVPEPDRCCRKIQVDGERRRCGGNLLEAAAIALTSHHPMAMTQSRLSHVLSTRATAFGIYKMRPESSLQVLKDLRVLAARIIAGVETENIDKLLGHSATSLIAASCADLDLGPNLRRWSTPKAFATTAPALITGLGLTMALDILDGPSIDEAATRLRPIISSGRASGREITPTTLRWGDLSAVVDALHIRVLADTLCPIDHLRYRIATAFPRYPGELSTAAVRNTPTCLWRDWSFRLIVGKCGSEMVRQTLSIMLLCTGTQISATVAARHLGSTTTEARFSDILNGLCCHPLWPNITAAMNRLTDYLANHPSPIDYERRRTLDYRALLPAAQWNEIYDPLYFGTVIDRDRVAELVRSWLFERLSLQPARRSPFATHILRRGQRRAEVVARFTPKMVKQLDKAAADFLKRNNVIDEPVTWSPPLSLIADIDLPGPDPTSVSTSQLHEAIRDGTTSMAAAARHFQLPIPAVRFLLERSPVARPIVRRQSQLAYAITQLSKSEFDRLYQRDRLSFSAIAARTGIRKEVISDLARNYAIDARGSNLKRCPVDPNWIYQEHVVKQRTLTDMADQMGVTISTVSRKAKKYGIAVSREPRRQRARKMS